MNYGTLLIFSLWLNLIHTAKGHSKSNLYNFYSTIMKIEIVWGANYIKKAGYRNETVNKDPIPYITTLAKHDRKKYYKIITSSQTDIKDTGACRPTRPSHAPNTQHQLQKRSHSIFPERSLNSFFLIHCSQNHQKTKWKDKITAWKGEDGSYFQCHTDCEPTTFR